MSKLKLRALSFQAVLAFLITFLLCVIITVITIVNRSNVEKLEMEQIIMNKSMKTSEVISKLLYKTEALSALVIQGDGKVDDFEKVAASIIDDPAIMNVLIAPQGVVSNVYPVTGNEAVIGLDFLQEGAGNKEAIMAKETGQLVFGGPFELIQGGEALVGRLPVYMESINGPDKFWGLVSVTLKYPQALDGVELDALERQGFTYQIWRFNPDDGERQVIAESSMEYNQRARFIEKNIQILNADWYFRVAPVKMWYQYAETWILLVVGFLVSFLVAFVLQSNRELKIAKLQVEEIARLDYLTDIYNRRYFMENAVEYISQYTNCYIILFDLDKFKEINDTLGHAAGDTVLKEIIERMGLVVKQNDLFARYGGEEFIVLKTESEQLAAYNMAEAMRAGIAEIPILYEGHEIAVTASFGVVQVEQGDDIEEAIDKADQALYIAKQKGRNRVAVYGRKEQEAQDGSSK